MGTETCELLEYSPQERCLDVKLNNPLMGTETNRNNELWKLLTNLVKLNNPLMGTET